MYRNNYRSTQKPVVQTSVCLEITWTPALRIRIPFGIYSTTVDRYGSSAVKFKMVSLFRDASLWGYSQYLASYPTIPVLLAGFSNSVRFVSNFPPKGKRLTDSICLQLFPQGKTFFSTTRLTDSIFPLSKTQILVRHKNYPQKRFHDPR
jgi:hypothetical protein